MRGRWLWVLGAIVALVVGAFGAAGFLLWRLDPKAEIERQLEAATGRDVTIGGEVEVVYFPVLGATLPELTIANMDGGRAPFMVSAKEARIAVSLRPLLDRKLLVRTLILVEPEIALEIGRDGVPNWAFDSDDTRKPSDPLNDFKDISLGEVRIENGRLTYADLAQEGAFELLALYTRITMDTLDGPLMLAGSAQRSGEQMNLELRFGEARKVFEGGETSFVANLGSEPMVAKFDGMIAEGGSLFNGRLEAQGKSLRRAISFFADPLGEGAGLEAFTLEGQVAFDTEGARFENVTFSLDETAGAGAFRLQTIEERPKLTANVQLSMLDLNPYLTSSADAAPAGDAPPVDAGEGRWDETAIDLEGLRGLDAEIAIASGPVMFGEMKLDAATAQANLAAGVLKLTLQEARLYGGAGEGALTLDASAPALKLTQDWIFQRVAVAPLLREGFGLDALEGEGELRVSLTTQGASQLALMRELDGEVRLQVSAGALNGVNLSGVATTISRALRRDFVGADAQTKFSTMSVNFTVADGRAATRDFRLIADDAQVIGTGVIDLGAQTLDLRIVPRAENLVSRLGLEFARLAVPFHVSGPWGNPTYRTDLRATQRQQLLDQVTAIERKAAADRAAAR